MDDGTLGRAKGKEKEKEKEVVTKVRRDSVAVSLKSASREQVEGWDLTRKVGIRLLYYSFLLFLVSYTTLPGLPVLDVSVFFAFLYFLSHSSLPSPRVQTYTDINPYYNSA